MRSLAFPVVRSEPLLKIKEPDRCLGHKRSVDRHLGIPFSSLRQPKAQTKRVLINVGNVLRPVVSEFAYVWILGEDSQVLPTLILNSQRVFAASKPLAMVGRSGVSTMLCVGSLRASR